MQQPKCLIRLACGPNSPGIATAPDDNRVPIVRREGTDVSQQRALPSRQETRCLQLPLGGARTLHLDSPGQLGDGNL